MIVARTLAGTNEIVEACPRSTFTDLVEDYLAIDFMSLWKQVLGRYPAFFQKLLSSPSKEVRLLANIVSRDPRSTTSKNLLWKKTYLRKTCRVAPTN